MEATLRTRVLRLVPWAVALGLIIAAFAVAGCSSAPHHGRVIQKQYLAAHFDYHQGQYCGASVTVPHRTSYRSNGRTYSSTYYTTTCAWWYTKTWRTWVNDEWGLRLDDNGNRGYRYVDVVTYDACQVGQYYDDSGVCR